VGRVKTDRELDELLGAYALDAVDNDERNEVEAYLARSPRARAEVHEHQQVAAALGNSTAEAPASIWLRIEASIDNTILAGASVMIDELPPLRALSSPARTTPTRDIPVRTISDQRFDTSSSSQRPDAVPNGMSGTVPNGMSGTVRTLRPNRFVRVLGIAAAACVAVLATSTIRLQQRVSSLRTEQTAVATERDSLKRKVDEAQADLQSVNRKNQETEAQLVSLKTRDVRFEQVMADPKTTKVKLLAKNGSPLATIAIGQNGVGYLVGDALPELSQGHTYQLWGVNEEKTVLSLGVFGRNPKEMPFAASEKITTFVITEEDGPGVVTSKKEPFAVGSIESV
jgi:hypothetical protein